MGRKTAITVFSAALLAVVPGLVRATEEVPLAPPADWEPTVVDWRIAVIATAGVMIFAIVLAIIISLGKGRSDGFGMHR